MLFRKKDALQAVIRNNQSVFIDTIEGRKLLYDIATCRTAEKGVHAFECDTCKHFEFAYNSCGNKHCPICGYFKNEEWRSKQESYLINTRYFHITFTIPSELYQIAYQNKIVVYDIIAKAASETLLEFGKNHKKQGIKIGLTSVLHTWGKGNAYHPHYHFIATGGGLTKDGKWQEIGTAQYLFKVENVMKAYRGKFLAFLKVAYEEGKLIFDEEFNQYSDIKKFQNLIDKLYEKKWVVHINNPLGKPENIIKYLSNYINRVAISPEHIIAYNEEKNIITFTYKDTVDNCKKKVMQLSGEEFVRRLAMHALPKGYCKVRHYGLFASAYKTTRINLCKVLTETLIKKSIPLTIQEKLIKYFGKDYTKCNKCETGHKIYIPP